ncbi:MAG: cell division protein FtsZ [Alphaproteobacteria bacterium]|nr:cell division protein FtsZ [Alphaproteobacteria bacterium]
MAINISAADFTELKPRILVFGVGGAGGNAVNNMVLSKLEGVEFLVANTDSQALVHSKAHHRLQIGTVLTQGLGAGSRPDIGQGAAEESSDEIKRILQSSHMVFITAGMGGGTGTGAAPVIAKLARELGILTVGVVTKPFAFEGQRRMRTADEGIERLKEFVDTLIVIPNQNLFRIANEKTTFAKAFEMADEVLYAGVRGVTDLMVMPGLINLDFADVRTVMSEMGTAMMGMGEAEGERRAVEAAEAAISNPLLDVSSMKGARGVLINITGGMDLTLYEVDEAANKIRAEVDPEANIIVGSTFDERLNGRMRVSVVATGISAEMRMQTLPAKVSAAVSKASGVRSTSMPTFAQPIVAGSTNPASSTGASPVPAPSHPVHSMQSEIVRAGLAGDAGLSTQEHSVCAPPQRGYGGVESHIFDPEMIESVGAALRGGQFSDVARQHSQRPPLPPQFQQETKKSGGFSVFGISIGGTSSAKRNPISKPGSSPSGMRLAPQGYASESSRSLPVASKSSNLGQDKSDEPYNAVSDDQLEIPAFLRRQVN